MNESPSSPSPSGGAAPKLSVPAGQPALPGVFIAFEGGDSCGKSTQLQRLVASLRAHGLTVVSTREPGATALGQSLRDLLLHGAEIDARTEALLFAADRAQHVAEVIRPALERGEVVLTDRYLDSSVAYQGEARGLGVAEIRDLSRWATHGLLPDLTILLDLDPKAAQDRRGEHDRMEAAGDSFHQAVQQRFRDLAAAEPDRYRVFDAARSRDELEKEIGASVWEVLAAHRLLPAEPGQTFAGTTLPGNPQVGDISATGTGAQS